ncbi:bromodomain adjacent to zinc finger domain protein 1A isoform X2 [Scleropages formosus]|uniref:bromodomain adjacent to zinc finger domain protein 1A isoform X2 n=1 Tax=Scleropages formosus TaxID=113540 RepID=UPI0008786B14|nr:bromodomain adjacent to zinc finger domain protein 1A isoform X2 [Scleropages formosus]
MPLLHRKPFVRQKPPLDLKPDEEVFLCKVTHEIFRTYDEFFERTILCNSLVWSCAVTGKPGLTYQEALESEKRARQSLQSFPSALVVPLLHLASLTHRTRLQEICDDVYSYVKDRFFAGETVDVVTHSGVRQQCRILEIQSPYSNGAINGHIRHRMEGDAIVISDSDDEGSSDIRSPKSPANGKKKVSASPSVFLYKVLPIKTENCEPLFVRASQINRKKNIFSRDRLKLFLKQHCEPQNGTIRIKAETIAKYRLLEHNFSYYFPDEPPAFASSSPGKVRGRRSNGSSPGEMSFLSKEGNTMRTAEKVRLLRQKEEMMALALEKAKMKKEREDAWEARKREKEDKERRKEEMKKMVEEVKQKRKEEKERMKVEKEKEREKLREEKKKYAERLKQWSRRREDMECDDLKDLPSPVPVKTRLPPHLFGYALMVLEFLQAFGELFDLKDEFPDGVTLEVLEEALVGCDPEGPLCELLFFFLSAIFQALEEEEEEVARDQLTEADTKDLTEALDEDSDPTQSAISAVASLAAAWPQLYQGCSLKQLDLDSCTLSEILRLHILASGADCTSANAKFRYQKQGGFSATDDPCVELRLASPGLLKKLSCTAVYDLLPGEKLKILHALCGKLLTLVSTRDFIEDCAEEQRQAKQELRELKAEQHRREREEAADRVRKRKEEKLKEQELRMKEKHEKLKEDEERNGSHLPEEAPEEMDTSTESHSGGKDHHMDDEEGHGGKEHHMDDEEGHTHHHKAKNTKATSQEKKAPEAKDVLTPEEKQQKEKDLQERIQKAASCTYLLPLGRDRHYRRYWFFPSSCVLFVEEDFSNLTEDMLLPQLPSELPSGGLSTEELTELSSSTPQSTSTYRTSPPVNRPNLWSFYSSPEEVEMLIDALNPRGYRECSLKEALLQEKERIMQVLCNCPIDRYHHPEGDGKGVLVRRSSPEGPEGLSSAERHMENRLKDLLLDIEDRIYQGTLGAIKVMDRSAWRAALEDGHYELLVPDLRDNNGVIKAMNKDVCPMDIEENPVGGKVGGKDRLQELKGETLSTASTSSSTPQPVNNCVHFLARALAQIEQGIERKFLKAPLGDEDVKKDQKTKKKEKKKDDEQSTERDDGSDSGRVCKTVQDRWRESLLGCSSLSQVFLHLSTLERSVIWAKSILNARCKVCRKKGDAENMMLCDACDRGHHIYCVRPRLKAVPTEEWFCPECRPKQRSRRLTSHTRSSIDSEELESQEEEEEKEDEEEESEESEDEQEESREEESEEEKERITRKGRAAVKLPPATKGGQVSSRSASQHTDSGRSTPKQIPSVKKGTTPKSSGKKGATTSNSRPPPRAGSRSSARLNQELLSTDSPVSSRPTVQQASSTQNKQAERQKRPASEMSPKAKVVLVPSSSSSNRRSSGRNQGVHELSACEQLTVELVRHEDSWPFMKLVSRTQVPDYYDIIKKPMALSIIREKVNNCEYKTASEYIDDVELMFSNCLEYNPRSTNEAKAGIRLQAFFHSQLQKLGLCPREGDQSGSPPKRPRM